MKKFSIITSIVFVCIIFFNGETSLSWGEELSEEQTLACESILCLSSGERPDECDSALNYFFGIKKDKPSDTIDARKAFLKKCPDSEDNEDMVSLIDVLVDYNCSACTVENLNARFVEVRILTRTRRHRFSSGTNDYPTVRVVDPELPAFCLKYYAAIAGHEYTAYSQYSPQPVYVGYNLGSRHEDDEGKEYYVISAESSSAQRQIAGTISETNRWEWNK